MGALGIDAWGLAVQIVAFLIFIYLFWRYALGPITNMLDERSRRIAESMAAADAMKAEMARASVRNEEILAEARQQAQQIIGQAREVSEATITRAQTVAGEQAEEYLTRAQATLRQETEQARLQLRQELADLAVMAAGRIVRKELDPAAQSRLIEETLAEATVPDGSRSVDQSVSR
jgi:F-type H+-transporting ATPase subunit b